MTLRNEIKSLLMAKGLNVKWLAEKLGYSQQNLYRKLRNETLKVSEYKKILEIIDKY